MTIANDRSSIFLCDRNSLNDAKHSSFVFHGLISDFSGILQVQVQSNFTNHLELETQNYSQHTLVAERRKHEWMYCALCVNDKMFTKME
jgi:hypothetical protein